jgi:hypothetical protein
MQRWGDFWRFTDLSARRLLVAAFGETAEIDVTIHGNVLVATAFLQGMSVEELTAAELDHLDEDYQVLITLRAKKGASQAGRAA